MAEIPERPPRAMVREELEKQWLAENRDAIASINAFIEQHGLLASKLRLPGTAEPTRHPL